MNIALPDFLKVYLDKLIMVFEIKEIWLFGSRINNREKEDSDWDIMIFANANVLNSLRDRTDLKYPAIDLFIVYDGNKFEQPWASFSETGVERIKNGDLTTWMFKRKDDNTAEYMATKGEDRSIYCDFLKMYKIWDKGNNNI